MACDLRQLTRLLPDAIIQGSVDKSIRKIAYDSRQVEADTLFICLPGHRVDGHDYISEAHRRGATAVLVERDVPAEQNLTVIRVCDTRAAMQIIAPYFFDFPGKKMRMVGITGTNGKTTTTHLVRSIFLKAGCPIGLMGTIHTLIGEKTLPVHNTTPDVIDLQESLAMMHDAGMEYAVMEVSSHALALDRVAGCEFDVAVFTNLTRDHLDFHQTFENYIAAKARLFDQVSSKDAVKKGKTAVINRDDPAADAMMAHSHCRIITYGVKQAADLVARDVQVGALGTRFTVVGPFGEFPLQLKITGMFNVYNVLAAIGAAYAEGIDPEIIRAALEAFTSVPGRFELVDAGQPFSIIVDYAHTPDGLENILKTAQEFATQRILTVFGCGGDRDRTKRPIMGKIAADYSDSVIITSDNPRTEDPLAIVAEIEAGVKANISPDKEYQVIPDRRQAIEHALRAARAGDIVIIAGKGHETYQILNDKTIHFDDREVAREIVREMK